MKEENFIYFLELLRILEKNDIAGRGIRDALVALMDSSESRLTEEQKRAVLDEFTGYEAMRSGKMGKN